LCADEEAIKSAGEHWRELSDCRAPLNAQATTADLEVEARWMQDSLMAVLDRHAPGRAPSARSKRWWTDDIEKERRLFGRATRDYSHDRINLDEYGQVRNDYYRYIRRAKRLAWEHFLEGVLPNDEESELAPDPGRCWRALRYTKSSVPSQTPAIKIKGTNGQPDRVAATAEEKEEIFMAQAFPPQPREAGDIQVPNTKVSVRACEVREALFAQSVKKAPGVDGISLQALRLLWLWSEEHIVVLVQGCIRTGYQPYTWKTAKGILLRKHDKPTYTIAKAYRVISLLSCLGKVVERAVATWIASYCETNEASHRGQLGCRRGRGTSDTVAQLVSNVEGAWCKKRTALALLLDVRGAFDRVNTKQLLRRMIQVQARAQITHGPEQIRIVALVDNTHFTICSHHLEFHSVVGHQSVGRPERPDAPSLCKATSDTN
jgi:hypothetical protein